MNFILSLLSAMAIAQPTLAQPRLAQSRLAQSTPPTQATQTIALKPADEPGQGAIASPTPDFRLLGYGLFLLQIGLIPLKLAKGNTVQTMTGDRAETIAPD